MRRGRLTQREFATGLAWADRHANPRTRLIRAATRLARAQRRAERAQAEVGK